MSSETSFRSSAWKVVGFPEKALTVHVQFFGAVQLNPNHSDGGDQQEGGDPERLDITFGGTALHAAVSSNQDDQACSTITITIMVN